MQRDAYSALCRYPNRRKTPVSILQMNGRVSRENLMEEFFYGYRGRRLALMTHTAGQDPRLPRLPKDIVVPDYKTFTRIHQPHFMYRLLPLLCANVEAFAAMQAICASPGSPFVITDRTEPSVLNLRFLKMCSNRERICEFFKEHTLPSELLQPAATRTLPIMGVVFQGAMLHNAAPKVAVLDPAAAVALTGASAKPRGRGSAAVGAAAATSSPTPPPGAMIVSGSVAAFVTTHETLSELSIMQRTLMNRFFASTLYNLCCGQHMQTHALCSADFNMQFMAVKKIGSGRIDSIEDRRARRHVLEMAARESIYVYEKLGEGQYTFAPP